jgi:prophage DNA circulation protein
MSWREQLRPVSFRGVEFYVDNHDLELGRRVQLHDYPFKDEAYPEDLGGKDGVYSFPGYVIGENYHEQRDKLIEALNQQGPGILVHRFLGRIKVQAGLQRMKESNHEGGMARFDLLFYKAGAKPNPTSRIDTQQVVTSRADLAKVVVQQNFVDDYQFKGYPGWVTDEAATVWSGLDSVLAKIDNADASLADIAAEPVDLLEQFNQRVSRFSHLGVSSQIAGFRLFNVGQSALSPFRRLFGFGDDLPEFKTITPSRQQQLVNQTAIVNLVNQTALIEASRASTNFAYDSSQDAIAVRNELSEALYQQMHTVDDDTFRVLQDLRAGVVTDLTERAANLKQIRSYTPQDTLPSLVVAHKLYQDASRADEIVARNQVAHPGFVTGGKQLEVLDD